MLHYACVHVHLYSLGTFSKYFLIPVLRTLSLLTILPNLETTQTRKERIIPILHTKELSPYYNHMKELHTSILLNMHCSQFSLNMHLNLHSSTLFHFYCCQVLFKNSICTRTCISYMYFLSINVASDVHVHVHVHVCTLKITYISTIQTCK